MKMLMDLFKSKKPIGLDIGANSLKMVELDVSGNVATLRSFGFSQTPAQSIVAGEIVDASSISTAIATLSKEIKTNRTNMIVGIWGSAVIVKRISMPPVENNLIADQIKWEAEQYIPFDLKEISLDYHILRKTGNKETMDVLLIAAKKAIVHVFLDIVVGAGFKCEVVDLSSFALANCFTFNYGVHQEPIAILDVGAQLTNFVVVQNAEVVFCRDIPFGGSNFTQDVMRDMGVNFEEAEGLKMSAASTQHVPQEVINSLNSSVEAFGEEIQNSFEFFRQTAVGASISQLFFTGGTSRMPGLIEQVAKNTGVTHDNFNPFLKVKYNTGRFSTDYIEQIKPYCGVAMGLALRKDGDT
ncbi:MAG: type IV pilus assembly protein PilM [Pseudomonadota bacterium]|nr:type IV pilus assembly protein PilM [Pseudomonadota bacterium]